MDEDNIQTEARTPAEDNIPAEARTPAENNIQAEEPDRTEEKNNKLRILLTVLLFLFIISACVLLLLLKHVSEGNLSTDSSIGGFIDLTPDYRRNTRFAIIGGRVFYPTGDPVNYTFPRELPTETAVEKKDDASDRIITLQQTDLLPEDDSITDITKLYPQYYSITRYTLEDHRNRNFRDDVKWIELLTWTDGEKKAWTQDADIDLFRNDEGRLANLSPGTSGYFRFQLNNKSGNDLHAVLSISEPEDGIHLPMTFTLEDEEDHAQSPATLLEKDNAVVLRFDIDKDSSGIYRLNWQWPYESGDDAYDGAVGSSAGRYILNAEIYAETID